MKNPPSSAAALIPQAHRLYCELTDQKLSLRFDRERMWFELLRQGYGLDDIKQVVLYLQREIRHGRRNVGALKLSNLLQPDRFEEDHNISKVKLHPPTEKKIKPPPQSLDPQEQERRRQKNLQALRQLRQQLNLPPNDSQSQS